MSISSTILSALQPDKTVDEKFYSSRGLVDLIANSSRSMDFIPPSVMERMRTLGSERAANLPAINDQNMIVETTPGFNFIPSNLPTTATYTFTAVDVFSGARFYDATFAENQVDKDWERANRLKSIMYDMAKVKETLSAAVLETIKTQKLGGITQVNAASAGNIAFSEVTDTLTFDKAAQLDQMFTHVDQLFSINEIPGKVSYVTNRGGLHAQINNALKNGAANAENLQALGLPDVNRYYQTTSIDSDGDIFNGYAIQDGAIGYVSNHPYDFARGTKVNGKEWSISDMEMEWTRSQLNVYTQSEATEATSLVNSSNTVMTTFDEIALWDRFYIVYPYNSDRANRVSGVFKIEGTTA